MNANAGDLILLAPEFPPSTGGIQTLTWEVYRRLADRIRLTVAGSAADVPADDRAFGSSVVRTRHSAGGGWTMLRHLAEARRLVRARRQPPLLVHCNHLFAGYLGWWMQQRWGVPYLVWVHGEELGKCRHSAWARTCLRHAAAVLVNSEFTADLVRQHVRRATPPIHKIVLGTSAAWWETPAHASPRPPDAPPVLLTVARLSARDRYKGVDTVLRAVAELQRRRRPVRYRIAGDGDDRPYLEALARHLGIADQVEFLGRVPPERLMAVYDACDLFLLCSREQPTPRGLGFEGFGIALLEANARGKAVVGGRSGGVPDAVEDGVSGVLADPTSPLAVADAIVPLLDDPRLRATLGEQGRARVRDRMNWDRAAEQVRAVHDAWAGRP